MQEDEFDPQKAALAALAGQTPNLSVPPPTVDKDEPGLQDATVSDAAMVAPLVGPAADIAGGAARAASNLDEAGAIFPENLKNAVFAQGKNGADFNPVGDAPSWFTTDRQIAEHFANLKAKGYPINASPDEIEAAQSVGQNTGFANLDPKNTLDLTGVPRGGLETADPVAQNQAVWKALHEKGLVDTPDLPDRFKTGGVLDGSWRTYNDLGIYPKAKSLGYDSVMINDMNPAGGDMVGYGALDPSIIKPALPKAQFANGGVVMGKIPKIQDSTLGDDQKGFQALANKKAQQNGTLPKAPPTTSSMQDALKGIAQPVQKFADGGTATDEFLSPQMPAGAPAQLPVVPQSQMIPPTAPPVAAPQAPASTPQAPNAISQAAAALGNTPDTPPSIYQGLSADDRLALQQKIMAANNSGPNLAAQAVGGIGDAISNSFGGKDTHFQKDIMANNQQQMQNKLGAVDTGRSQRLEDVTGNQEAQMNDPSSHISQSMRNTFKAAGINVASGMTGAQMMKIAPAIGDLAMKQATIGIQQQGINNTIANQDRSRKLEAAKGLQERSILQKAKDMFSESPETAEMKSELNAGGSDASQSTGQTMQTKSGIKYTVN